MTEHDDPSGAGPRDEKTFSTNTYDNKTGRGHRALAQFALAILARVPSKVLPALAMAATAYGILQYTTVLAHANRPAATANPPCKHLPHCADCVTVSRYLAKQRPVYPHRSRRNRPHRSVSERGAGCDSRNATSRQLGGPQSLPR